MRGEFPAFTQEDDMAEKKHDPFAALKRAVDTARTLTDADLATVVSRLKSGLPKMGLVDMARVEEIAEKLDAKDRKYLIERLEGLKK